MIPPPVLVGYQYASELKAAGEQYPQYYINVCGLKPEARVLDIGCAIGRIAAPLTFY
jgi:2-polyprenyl-3-methyl-5-hydroxy-6-metoxy-1,4-benzoquinol methylase